MRLAVCALSAVLLSGCAWMPWGGSGHGGKHAMKSQYGAAQGGHYKGHQQKRHNPCQIFSPAQPVPQGCNPSQVTLAAQTPYGGFPQQPDFSGGYTSQGYGSHAANAGQHAAYQGPQEPRLKKPKWRGQMSMGIEKSNSGALYAPSVFPVINPYNPSDFNEFTSEGSVADGEIIERLYYTDPEEITNPEISFDDVHSTPFNITGGLEYIMGSRTTLFANAGYAHAKGKSVGAESHQSTLLRDERVISFNPDGSVFSDITSTSFVPNENVANFRYDFTDMRRINLEAGARHYLNPILTNHSNRSITPFVGASVGATHHNSVDFDVTQDQRFLERAFESGGDVQDYYDVINPRRTVNLYDSQWVPSGQLNAGLEWQMTPKTALAFETGLKFEGARDYSNGEKGDSNIAVPFTIRGSYNF